MFPKQDIAKPRTPEDVVRAYGLKRGESQKVIQQVVQTPSTPSQPSIDVNALKQEIIRDVLAQLGSTNQVQADWNESNPESSSYIQNRTHYTIPGKSITWDGSTEGRDSFDASLAGIGVFYKISDDVWTVEECISSIYKPPIGPSEEGGAEILYDENIGYVWATSWLVFASAFTAIDLTGIYGFAIPSPGIYVCPMGEDWSGVDTTLKTPDTAQTIDKKYLPDDVAYKVNIMGGSIIMVNDIEDPIFLSREETTVDVYIPDYVISDEELYQLGNYNTIAIALYVDGNSDVSLDLTRVYAPYPYVHYSAIVDTTLYTAVHERFTRNITLNIRPL